MEMDAKKQLVQRVKEDLVGPGREDETLAAYPSDIYLTGILFPARSGIAQEDQDQAGAEGASHVDGIGGSDEVSLANSKRPASMGVSFVVEADGGATPFISVELRAAVYRREQLAGETPLKVQWRRVAVESKLGGAVALDFPSKDFKEKETGVGGLHVHIRTSPWGGKQLVTVAMINARPLPDDYERDDYEPLCFFQTEVVVKPVAGTRFCPRPLGGSAVDGDTLMAKLIYRDVQEYAVGHTCSAGWEDGRDGVGSVFTTWLPVSTVRGMSAEGVEEFRHLSERSSGPVLETRWLSESRGAGLTEGLKLLPAAYQKWLDAQNHRFAELKGCGEIANPDLIDQGEKHFYEAGRVAERMMASIELLEKDGNVEAAFRLANRAIMLQRQWGEPNGKPLMWRPFQLGFILLCLQSIASDSHEDREYADLLWFPTGGGKTEAYLGLIAFTLFLRRLRYGKAGAGVAAFMRYTLRLLTVQQFQRAAALVCACDAIRQGADLPGELNVELGEIPFSLGLWVGGEATPNSFAKGKEALEEEGARNSPKQLTRCPRHRGEVLRWRADMAGQSIYATCDDADCLWHSRPLPVWTVDDDIYRETPSLIIGTIDKFAQLARNERTRGLFGQGVPFRHPDLIIQDELHLISGPLGSMAGLYEVAIDRLCSKGKVRPKIIASTATIRQASSQIEALFDRKTCLFPPPVLDATNSGFAVEDTVNPGRTYLGMTTAGRSAKFCLQATAASLLQAATSDVLDESVRDDFWTLVAYFNSLRELGGALVLMQDDVAASIGNLADQRDERARELSLPMELTSRVSSSELKEYLDQLEIKCGADGCTDIVLASNMISVGVDVPRLGTMIVNGQPKGMAEYIQATSRVGRRRGGPGGLVVVIYNNAKARDRSHFETFRTWHSALYRDVEATSVTPFAPRARSKALHAALVILSRHLIPDLTGDVSVSDIGAYQDEVEGFIEEIVARARRIDEDEARNVEDDLQRFLEDWEGDAKLFRRYWNDYDANKSLLISAERAAAIRARSGGYYQRATPTPNSMRNVEVGTLFRLKEELR